MKKKGCLSLKKLQDMQEGEGGIYSLWKENLELDYGFAVFEPSVANFTVLEL